MAQWDYLHPEVGDVSALSASLSVLAGQQRDLDSAESGARASRSQVTSQVWSGESGAQWLAAVDEVVGGFAGVGPALAAAQQAISAYVGAVNSIKTRAAAEKHKLAHSAGVVARLDHFTLNPIDNAHELIQKAVAQKEIIEAEVAIAGLGLQRQAADDALVAALAKAVPASWVDQKAAFAAVGLTSAADLTPAAIAAAMAQLAGRVGTEIFNTDDREQLLAMMRLYGSDNAVMDLFFRELGGDGTVRLIDKLGGAILPGANNQATLELAQRVREGLSLASIGWDTTDPTWASQFAHDLLYGTVDPNADAATQISAVRDRAQAIGWLFSNPSGAPMGERVTVSLAEEIDTWERAEGHGPLAFYGELEQSTAARLWAVEHPSQAWSIDGGFMGGSTSADPTTGQSIVSNDASGRVLEMLGIYPDAALDFLNPTEDADLGVNRIDYWFRERNWSIVDKFEGPGALWFGAQQADGGPYFTGEGYNSNVDERAADVASRVMFALAGPGRHSESYKSENLSEQGAYYLGAAMSVHLDSVADTLAEGSGIADRASAVQYTVFGAGGERWRPVFTPEVLRGLLGPLGEHPSGATVIRDSVAENTNRYFELVSRAIESGADPSAVQALTEAAMERANQLDGVIAGAEVMERLDIAARADALVDQNIAAVGSLVGLIPIPGVGAAAGVLIDAGVSVGTEIGGNAWAESLHKYDDAAAAAFDGRPDREAVVAAANVARMYDIFALPMTAPPPNSDGRDFDSWLDARSAELSMSTGADYSFRNYLDYYQDGAGPIQTKDDR